MPGAHPRLQDTNVRLRGLLHRQRALFLRQTGIIMLLLEAKQQGGVIYL